MEKNDSKKQTLAKAIVFALIVGIVMLVVFFLTYKKETISEDNYITGDISALVCTTSDTESAFFDGATTSVEHKIKIMLVDDKISKMTYGYDGLYGSKDMAEHDNAVLHAKYNEYMGRYNFENGKLNPVFQVSNNHLRIDLFLDFQDGVDSAVGKIFYIDDEVFDVAIKYSSSEIKDYYEKKDFSCKTQD